MVLHEKRDRLRGLLCKDNKCASNNYVKVISRKETCSILARVKVFQHNQPLVKPSTGIGYSVLMGWEGKGMQTPPNLNFKISRIGQPDPVSKGKDRKGRKPATASIERFLREERESRHPMGVLVRLSA